MPKKILERVLLQKESKANIFGEVFPQQEASLHGDKPATNRVKLYGAVQPSAFDGLLQKLHMTRVGTDGVLPGLAVMFLL